MKQLYRENHKKKDCWILSTMKQSSCTKYPSKGMVLQLNKSIKIVLFFLKL